MIQLYPQSLLPRRNDHFTTWHGLCPRFDILGRRKLVFEAERTGVKTWRIRYFKSLLGFAPPPVWPNTMNYPHRIFQFVRETFIVSDALTIAHDALGCDCRVLGFTGAGVYPLSPEDRHDLQFHVRRVWYVDAHEIDGQFAAQLDQYCVSPVGGPIRIRNLPPQVLADRLSELRKYRLPIDAKAQGLKQSRLSGKWLSPEQYQEEISGIEKQKQIERRARA